VSSGQSRRRTWWGRKVGQRLTMLQEHGGPVLQWGCMAAPSIDGQTRQDSGEAIGCRLLEASDAWRSRDRRVRRTSHSDRTGKGGYYHGIEAACRKMVGAWAQARRRGRGREVDPTQRNFQIEIKPEIKS
jgi:hypothetical protein